MTNDDLFDRLLDHMELYADLRKQYTDLSKAYYAKAVEDTTDEERQNLQDRDDVIFQQRVNMQKMLEEIIINTIRSRE